MEKLLISRHSENVARSLGAILVQRFVADCKHFTDRLSSLSEEFRQEREPKNRLSSLMGHVEELHRLAAHQFRDLPTIGASSGDDWARIASALIPFRLAEETLGATRNRLLELDQKISIPRREFLSAFQKAGSHLHELSLEARAAFDGICDAIAYGGDGNIVAIDVQEPQAEWTDKKNTRRCDLIDREIAGTITDVECIELNRLQNEATSYRDRVAPLPLAGAQKLHAELLRKKQEAESYSEE